MIPGRCCVVGGEGESRMKATQRGSALVAELLALAIIGSAVIVMLSGLSTGSIAVAAIDRQVSAEDYARWQMEAIKAASYQPNPTSVPYPSVSGGEGYSVFTQVTYWITSTESFTTTLPTQDSGLQQIRVRVYLSQQPGDPVYTLQGYKAERP